MRKAREEGRATGGRSARRGAALGLAAMLLGPATGVGAAWAAGQAAQQAAGARAALEPSVRAGPDAAELELRRADGVTLRISFSGGEVRIDGRAAGTYVAGGALEGSWRELLGRATQVRGEALADALRGWTPRTDAGEEGAADRLRAALAAFQADGGSPAAAGAGERRGLVLEPGGLALGDVSESLRRLEAAVARIGPQAAEAAGELALVVHDDLTLGPDRVVPGNLALLDGTLELGGTVEGHVLVLDGELRLGPGALVRGDVLQAGGEVRDLGGRVEGERVRVRLLGPEAAPATPAPAVARERETRRPGALARFQRNVSRATGDVVRTLGFYLVAAVVGALVVYFARPRLEVVADTARGNFVRSFGAGIAGQILFFPVLLVLVVAVVTILVIPFYLIGVALALALGYLAAAHALGETVALQRYRWFERLQGRRSNSYYYTLSGLALLLAPFAVAGALQIFGGLLGFARGVTLLVAVVGTWVAVTTGFGAVLLSRGGSRADYAHPATPAGGDGFPAEEAVGA